MLAILAGLVALAHGAAPELDATNFDDVALNAGKAAFVKFYAPWCGHCKKMKPSWDQLADEFKDSSTVVIADVDCTKDNNKDLCSRFGVRGYPTIKYFTGSTGPDGAAYEGGRELADLKKFASTSLGPSCDWTHKDLCSAEKLAELETVGALTQEVRDTKIAEHEKAIKEAEKHFEAELEKLQASYKTLMETKEKTVTENSGPLGLYKSVSAGIKKAAGGGHEDL